MSNLRSLVLAPLFVVSFACSVESEPDDSSAAGTSTGATASSGATANSATGGAASGGDASSGGGVGNGASASSGGESMGGDANTGGAQTGGATTGGAGGGSSCPHEGNVTYTLAQAAEPTAQEQEAYALITAAMDEALSYYNCYTNIERTLNVTYNPGVATADGNENGSIRFGQKPYMNHITAMHEISHVVGVGNPTFDSMIESGIFTGESATSTLRSITGEPDDFLHGDTQHFWPYGLNQVSEVKGEQDLVAHCQLVMAIREDLGF